MSSPVNFLQLQFGSQLALLSAIIIQTIVLYVHHKDSIRIENYYISSSQYITGPIKTNLNVASVQEDKKPLESKA